MTHIEREKRTVEMMIRLYCRKHMKSDTLPDEYAELLSYAHTRLDRCKFGEEKKSCRKCPIHCYAAEKRELMRKVMRWAGPRLILYHPMETLRHYLRG